jgi:uridine kinase
VTSPVNGVTVAPAKYIIFEGPLGRVHQKTGQSIDYLVFIDTPLEVGLARMVLRDIANIA